MTKEFGSVLVPLLACHLVWAENDIPVGLDASAEGLSITNYVTPA